ncbi:MAG: IS5 family transposase [Euryarchaeota archaeon]|nr:IS5 family transposase [Euryarchaeota archaeon]
MEQLNFLKSSRYSQPLRCEKFLNEMSQVIPWQALCELIQPSRPIAATGRKPRDTELMLRIYCLQQWYNLSDPGAEDAIRDRLSFQRFLRLDPFVDTVPDETTILNFRHLLEENDLQEVIFKTINQHLEDKGLLMKRGTLVDATIIAAPSSTKNKSGKRDPEMSSTRKGNQYYFGMKAHIGVDSDSSLVHSLTGTEAKRHDSTQREALLHGEETVIGGDKGYADEGFKKSCRAEGVVYAICDKAKRNHPLSNGQKKRNRQLSGWRAKVEHPFQVIKCQWNYRKVRYKGLKKNTGQLYMLFGLYNLFRVRRKLMAC